MSTQQPGGPGTFPGQNPYETYVPEADWNSPLWGQPETVAAGWSPRVEADAPEVTFAPAAQPRRVSRALLATTAAALLVVGLVGASLVKGALSHDPTTQQALPTPSISAPAVPAPVPSQPSLTLPSLPSLTLPGEGSGQQGSSGSQAAPNLTDQQKAAIAAVSPGLVDIVSTIGYDGAQGAGTGMVLNSDGLVLTNHHVVAGATSISVTDIGNGQTYSAKVLGYDRSHDVALIQLADASGLQTAPLGDSSTVAVGDAVVAVGNALGKGGTPSPAVGKVTDLNQSITAQDSANGTAEQLSGLIQVDAPIQPGDSGGALVNADGKVIGMVTAGSVSGSGSRSSSGLDSGSQTATDGFAVPLATARAIADEIVAGHSSSTVHIGGTAFLGLQVGGNAGAATVAGVAVSGTVQGSAAAGAGIVAGDVITALDGHSVPTADALKSVLDSKHPGDTLSVRWTDAAGKSHTANVTLAAGPTG